MNRWFCLLFTFAAVLGCTSVKKVNGPDGQPGWYMIKCEDDRANCIEKAGEICSKGYEVADDHESAGAYVVGRYAGTSSSYRMLVKCHEGAAP